MFLISDTGWGIILFTLQSKRGKVILKCGYIDPPNLPPSPSRKQKLTSSVGRSIETKKKLLKEIYVFIKIERYFSQQLLKS